MFKFINKLWTNFCTARGRCPRCFTPFLNFSDYRIGYGYCQNHITEAYYEDRTKVIFKEDIK